MSIPDAIEREIHIAAPIERVWALISEPGWWVNAGEITDHTIQRDPQQPDLVTVTDDKCGAFTLQIVELRSPSYAAFRWMGGAADDGREVVRTLVEFSLTPADGGTTVRVVESGWSDVVPSERVRSEYDDNVQGWEHELEAAKMYVEAR